VRRGTAAPRRAHLPVEGDTPGCCAVCNLPLGKTRNDLHVDQLPPVDPDITAAESRRLGEHD
jgi:hypothetical protein